jgi:hypothetical protein
MRGRSPVNHGHESIRGGAHGAVPAHAAHEKEAEKEKENKD